MTFIHSQFKMRREVFRACVLFIFLLVTSCLLVKTHAQTLPPFKMMLSSKKIFEANELPKNKPVILIYFDPDCDHCQTLMKAFFKKIDEFKKATIVLVTYKPLNELVGFEKAYDTKKYTNLTVGTEGTTFYLRFYYGITTLPFTALYDTRGKLVYAYKKDTSVPDLADRLKKIK